MKIKEANGWAEDRAAILIIDVWWGWLDQEFRDHVKTNYPWLKLIYVPADCTPVAQPVDLGLAAWLKARLRKFYGIWVAGVVRDQIVNGVSPDAGSWTCRLLH
eukprot:Lithocolla_globosa_v1_NODE_1379_length_2620_cov_34.296686.p6 type:complete len:103 gc:universal NODE_1379_length_2620_cov_34.296686:1868-2176(+)